MNTSVNTSRPFIHGPTTLLTFAGGVAYRFLPVSALPQVDFPTISVSANLPEAIPETMAVATPLERQFGRVTEMTSASYPGSTSAAFRSQSQYRRRAGGHQRVQPAGEPQLPKGELPGFSDLHHLPYLRRARQRPDVRCRAHDHEAGTAPGSGAGEREHAACVRVELNPMIQNKFPVESARESDD